jgi:predicted DNA-binding protein YlxM (UPF0122 family)
MKIILTEKQVDLLRNLILESSSGNIIEDLLEKLKKHISDLLKRYEESFEKTFEIKMSEYDKEIAKWMITGDMVESIEKYTQPTDELVSVEATTSRKGNLEIFAKIKRGDEVYQLNTEVIVASGVVQRAHYRYLTKTNLPKTGNKEFTSKIAEKIKRLTKGQKIENDILNFEKRIKKEEESLEENLKKSDEEILDILRREEHGSFMKITWDEIVRRGADKNYDGKSDFEQKQKESIKRLFDSWKNLNIKSKIEHIKSLRKEINKLNTKLEKLNNE